MHDAKHDRTGAGFRNPTLREILWGAAVILGLVVVGQVARGPWSVTDRDETLQNRLVDLRVAVERYREDHGFYPASPRDFNAAGDPAVLAAQLTGYTDARGEPVSRPDEAHPFGPYLSRIPAEPVTGSSVLRVDTRDASLPSRLAETISAGTGRGGWYYEARTGQVVADLGQGFPASYARL